MAPHGLAHCVFSETSSSPNNPLPSLSASAGIVPAVVDRGGEAVWLTLRYSMFLFLSSGPGDAAPYAFIRLQDAVLRDVDYTAHCLVLAGRPKAAGVGKENTSTSIDGGGVSRENTASGPGSAKSQTDAKVSTSRASFQPFGDTRLPLPLCFLLADGRFQPFDALWLEIQFNSDEDLESWARELGAACDGLDLQEKEQQSRVGGKFTGPKGRGATRAPTVPLPGSPPPSPPVMAEERNSRDSRGSGSIPSEPLANTRGKIPSPRPAG